MKDYDKKVGELDIRIKQFGDRMITNMESMVSLMCLKRDLTYTNTKEILEYHLKEMVDKYGEDWYKDDDNDG